MEKIGWKPLDITIEEEITKVIESKDSIGFILTFDDAYKSQLGYGQSFGTWI